MLIQTKFKIDTSKYLDIQFSNILLGCDKKHLNKFFRFVLFSVLQKLNACLGN